LDGGEEVGEAGDGALDGAGLVAADQRLGLPAPVGVVLVQPDQQLGVEARQQLLRAADGAVLAGGVERQAEDEAGDVLVVGLAPAQHRQQPVVEGGGAAAPAVHGQLGPEGDAGEGVAGEVAGQGAFDQAGVGAFAVDEEELAPGSGGGERLPFDIGGLAHAGGADDQPRAGLHQPRHHHQAVLVGPAEVPVDPRPQRDRPVAVVADGFGAADGGGQAPLRLALGLADLGGVKGLPTAGEVERRRKKANRKGEGDLWPQERARSGQVDDRVADLADEPQVAGEVVRQGRAGAAVGGPDPDQGGKGGKGQLPPAQPGHA
jgi:hypothetical protein